MKIDVLQSPSEVKICVRICVSKYKSSKELTTFPIIRAQQSYIIKLM